ncbi:hypothetical protein RJ55_07220 [Drechmeria coniospora]|nr:hypothetical protein RJ55_07220 [Drechmeria coniospora]
MQDHLGQPKCRPYCHIKALPRGLGGTYYVAAFRDASERHIEIEESRQNVSLQSVQLPFVYHPERVTGPSTERTLLKMELREEMLRQ